MQTFRPPSVLIYGPTKVGKTTAVANALEPSTYFYFGFDSDGIAVVADPRTSRWLRTYNGDFAKAVPEYGNFTDPKQPFREVERKLDEIAKRIAARQLIGAVIDTATAFAERARAASLGMFAERESYGVPSSLSKRQMLRIVTSIQHAGGLLIVIAHEQAPSPDGKPGGPKLPGQLLEDLPGAMGVVLRMEQRASMRPGEPAKRWLICDPDNRAYITANRYGTSQKEEPAEALGDLLSRTWERARLIHEAAVKRDEAAARAAQATGITTPPLVPLNGAGAGSTQTAASAPLPPPTR